MSFYLGLNHAQSRLAADRLTAVAGGLELNGSVWSGTWIDPVTHTLMLRPKPLDTEWYLESTGANAKWGLSDFMVGPGWEERAGQHWAGPWLAVKDAATNPAAISLSSFPKNMGLAFSWFSYGAGDTFLQYQIGWNDTADDSSGVALHLWSDGRVDVFRNGNFVESGKVSGAKSKEVRRLQVFEVMLIPMRGRELLVLSQSGDGFSVVFNEIDPAEVDPEITPGGKIWFRCESGATQAQIAPLRFSTSGFATSLKTSFLEAPVSGEELANYENDDWLASPAPYKIYGFPGFGAGVQTAEATLVEWDGSTVFVPDGDRNEVRIRVALTSSDDRFSPFVTGAQVAYSAISEQTNGGVVFDGSEYVSRATLSVPDSVRGVVLDVDVVYATELNNSVSEGLSGGSIPVELRVDSNLVLDGVSSPMRLSNTSGALSQGRFAVHDRWALVDSAVFADRVPLDGLPFRQALELLVQKSGLDGSRLTISDSGPKLPYAAAEVSGAWGLLIEAGDRVGDWIRRLMDTFAPGWWYGFRPALDGSGEEFYALPQDELEVLPAASLSNAVGFDPVYRSLERASIEPLANEVRVTGVDPRTGRPMQSVRTDFGAQTVATSVPLRPAGWAGSIRRFALVDAGLTEQQSIDQACDALFHELTARREMVQFESEFLRRENGVPLWRGDVVNLVGVGDVRIRSFGVEFSAEASAGTYRRALYTGVLLP